jgi:glycosyltransferase involved in cell wall biosynthesis
MVSLKQLVALVLGHETTVRGYAPAAMNFADTAAHGGEANGDQSRDQQGLVGLLNGVFAQKVVPAFQAPSTNFTICRGFGPDTVSLVLRRSLLPQSRVLFCLKQLPPKVRGLHRFVLSGVDAILVESDALARAVLELGIPAPRIVSLCDPGDLALFNQSPRARSKGDAYRIIHVGDLEPEAGVAELLPCVTAWANRNPDRTVEIWWSGEGCLRGVLEAQPLPLNLSQRFYGETPRAELASMFLECDLLAVPALSDSWIDAVPEAVAAQLPVLGSNRSRTVRELIADGVTGWVFDPFEAGAMAGAVDLALSKLPQELEHMRTCAAVRFRQPAPGLNERLRRAMRIDAAEMAIDVTLLGFSP